MRSRLLEREFRSCLGSFSSRSQPCAMVYATPAAAVDGVVLITQSSALAGNVTPGDTEGFPVSISRTGSYRLAGNLQVTADKNGIEVTATEVSIDLNGFRMDGAGVALTGIGGYQRSLTVRNGTLRAFRGHGISTRGALLIVEDMRISENGGSGVYTDTANSVSARIESSTIFGNAGNGISCSQSCHVEGNIIQITEHLALTKPGSISGQGGRRLETR